VAESALVVFVPEAEPLVSTLRLQYDESARLGAPAHLTVLYPFMDPRRVDQAVLDQCAHVIAAHRSSSFQLRAVGRFPGMVYLEPNPAAPFVELTLHLVRVFPKFPAYRGEFSTVIPHLTVARGSSAEIEQADMTLTARLKAEGPVKAVCSAVTLIENSSGRWRPMQSFPLAT
jgi:2'-5' RNA ligase